jgi:hypothetical protein
MTNSVTHLSPTYLPTTHPHVTNLLTYVLSSAILPTYLSINYQPQTHLLPTYFPTYVTYNVCAILTNHEHSYHLIYMYNLPTYVLSTLYPRTHYLPFNILLTYPLSTKILMIIGQIIGSNDQIISPCHIDEVVKYAIKWVSRVLFGWMRIHWCGKKHTPLVAY